MRLIDADVLKIHKFLTPDVVEAKKWLPIWTKGYQQGWNEAIDAIIDNAPTVERSQGEWKLHGMIYYCSECGHDCGESGDNFCGNCGADMRGGYNND